MVVVWVTVALYCTYSDVVLYMYKNTHLQRIALAEQRQLGIRVNYSYASQCGFATTNSVVLVLLSLN